MTKSFRYAPALLLLAGVAIASPACAAQVYGQTYPRGGVYGGYRDFDRRAYDNGPSPARSAITSSTLGLCVTKPASRSLIA